MNIKNEKIVEMLPEVIFIINIIYQQRKINKLLFKKLKNLLLVLLLKIKMSLIGNKNALNWRVLLNRMNRKIMNNKRLY